MIFISTEQKIKQLMVESIELFDRVVLTQRGPVTVKTIQLLNISIEIIGCMSRRREGAHRKRT